MKNKKIVKMFSIVVAMLMVISVIAAASTVLTAEDEETLENIEEFNEIDGELGFESLIDRDKLLEDRTSRVDQLDVLDPELTQILSGADISGETISSSNELLTDPHTIDQHSVEAVHDMGILGEGVTVSLMDTGFDMAHPDLIGTHAVFEYDEETMEPEMEMYDGYPIAYDPVSMGDFVFDGEVSQDYESWWGTIDNSWYVNTSYETTAYEEDGTIWADYTEKPEGFQTYEMPEEIEDGDLVRFGLHPDEKLHAGWGERPAVLLTQDDEGQWANVYADLWMDRSFADEKAAYIDGEVPDSEVLTRDITGDGIADISGGMLYFVASEHEGEPMPLPYAQHFRETMNTIINLYMGYPPGTIEALLGYDAWDFLLGEIDEDLNLVEPAEFHTTPESGDMIALMGDFNSFGSYGAHGTWTASAVAGQAVTGVPDEDMLTGEPSPFPPTPEGGGGLPRGLSPNASIIPMGRFFDPLPADNPLGMVPTTYSSIFFTTEGYTGDVTITSDSADIASSSFGRTIDENHGGFNFYERLFDYVGTQHTQNTLFINSQGNSGSGFGTVSAPSGAQGVLSVGATGNQLYRVDGWNMFDGGPNPWYGEVTGMTSTGPHSKGSHGPDIMTNGQFGYGADPVNQQIANIGGFQGNNSWTLWSGTSLSAPNAAGIAALVFEAYVEAHGEAPDAATLKNIIMQGANDINNTPNLQGPGDANALNSVLIAQGEGLYSEEFQWRPGTNPEVGQHVEHHVNMIEPGETQTDTLTLENWNDTDPIDYEMSAYRERYVNSTQIQLNSGPAGRVPLLAITETGVYELIYNEDNENWDLSEDPIAELDDPHADILRFGTHTPNENQDGDYSLTEFYHWTDVNENGSFDGFEERTRMGYTMTNLDALGYELTSDYFTIYDALERAEDGIIIQMNNVMGGDFDFTLNIEQYNQVEWDWIEFEGATTGTIDAGDFLEYDITANISENSPKGIYSGKLMINDVTNERILPVPITITVGESTNLDEPYVFGEGDGDSAHDQGIYRNDRLYGSWGGGLTGDWRFYTFHLEEDILDRDITLELNFDDEMSDMTAFLLGGATHDMLEIGLPEDPFSVMDPNRYGVNTLETIDMTDIDQGDYVSLVREEGLEQGTYIIALQSHQISGHEPSQTFSGELSANYVRTIRDEARVVDRGAINFPGELLSIPDGETNVSAFFRYRQIGEDDWHESPGQTLTDTGEFDETVTGLEDGTYEWKPVISWNSEQTGVIGSPVVLQDLSQWFESSPEDGDYIQGDSITIEGRMEDFEYEIVESTITLGDWFPYDNVNIEDNHLWWDLPLVLSEGTHTYDFYLQDEYGNEHTEVVEFHVLNREPFLEITSEHESLTFEEEFVIEGNVDIDSSAKINGVEVYDPNVEIQDIFYDNLEDGDLGYTTREDPEGKNEWGIRDHGSAEGEFSWDFGDGNYDADAAGALSELISPELDLTEARTASLSFYHWRDFEDQDVLWDGGNLKISTDGIDGSWELLEPEEGYDGTIQTGYNNPLGGEPGWGHSQDWELVTVDLSDYVGETIHLNWQAGADDYETAHEGWRIDGIHVEGLLPVEETQSYENEMLMDYGSFSHEVTLEEGLNIFDVVAEDAAGNIAETKVYALYLPQIPELEEEIASVEENLQNQIYDIEGDISDIEENILDLQTQIDNITEEEIPELQSQIDSNSADILNLQSNIQNILEEEIPNLREDIQAQIDNITEEEIPTLRDEMESQIDTLETDLESQIDTLETDLKSQIDTLETELQADLTSLQTELDDYKEEQQQIDEEQDEEISMARNLGIVGLVIAILALVMGIFLMTKIGEKTEKEPVSETEESFDEEEFEEEF